ncbi:MAG TPA: carboxypeptidase M32 [Candidatus Acidoferrales bacterium]|nr:carboxypeptidase M32 [Candidatus Acidoferrales bacterium]
MSQNQAITEIAEKYKPLWALDSVGALLEWDMETYMPLGSSSQRGFALAQTQLIKQDRMVQLAELAQKAEKSSGLNEYEKGFVRVLRHDLDYYLKLPPKLMEDILRTGTEGTVVWREARKKSDFSMFQPYLEKMINLKRQEAEKLGYEGHPYNALLDRYEEGLTISDVDRIFSPLAPALKGILDKVLSARKFPSTHPLEEMSYEQAAMKRVNEGVLRLLQMPEKTFRMDVSTHPFTTSMSIEDVRITTRYEGKDFKASLYSTVHESGHAIYDLQVDPSLDYTPLSRATSLGVHESQSRFWENFIGRSREFINLVCPTLKANLPFVAPYSENEIYRYVNSVKPSLIRVDADELTYNFHIMLRYELEKKLIGGEVEVSEAPSMWKDLMEKYLGVRPQNDAEGILQDVHWSGGMIGYFATYSLGNIIAGMINNHIRKDLDLKTTVAKGDFRKVKDWLKEKIHRHGAIYSPKELQTKLFGEQYNPQGLINYLQEKYLG